MARFPLARTLAAGACAWLLSASPTVAAAPDELWREVREADIPRNAQARQIVPERSRAYALNRGRLQSLLQQAPPERSQRPLDSRVELALPLPGGDFGNFRIVESPVMDPTLATRYPQIRTYLGQGIDDPTASARIDVTPKGFHAQVIGAGGTLFIDPFQPGDADHYIVYRKHDHRGERGICLVTGQAVPEAKAGRAPGAKAALQGEQLRTYRLAMAATGEYTTFHGGTVIDGLSAIVTTMNRVNGIYERELSVRMVLVANNDLLIYTNAGTDPYTNTSSDLNANQSTIDAVIGSANYDIGHLVGTGGGGIAQLAAVCGTGKARGLTGSSAPVADGFDIDYVAHEMGHQFAGNHTFNGSGGSCSGANRNASTAYEPGGGITIQAYAGICVGDDLQPNSEDFFHRASLDEMIGFTTLAAGSTCGVLSGTGNTAPTVSTTPAFVIPGRTPFTLTATGSDGDGDPLTYSWEQLDLGAANPEGVLSATSATGPMFRAFAPTSSPARTFPSWRYILQNANAVPATAPLPGTTSPAFMAGEVLPNVSRVLSFDVTVRDNRAGGGGTAAASTLLTVNNASGPFAVTAPNTALSWAAGSAQTVTWNVANTASPPVSTANVRISLSLDGGNTWPVELAASTPNDGSHGVTLPAGLVASTQARVRVEAVGNVYFDVSDTDFTVTSANTAPAIAVTAALNTRQGATTASAVVATVSDGQDAAGTLAVSVSGAPPELVVSVQNSGGNVTLFATASCTLVAPTGGSKVYPVLLRVTDSGGAVSTRSVNVNVGSNRTPTLASYATLQVTQNSVRTATPTTPLVDPDGNLQATSISPTTLPGGGTVGIAPNGTVTVTTTASTPFGTYTFKPQAADSCGATETRSLAVTVGAPFVSLAIAGSTVATGNALLEPNECNQLNVSVRNNGNSPATAVSAVLSTGTPNVTITQPNSAYADIPPGEVRSNSTPFQVSTAGGLACFSNVGLSLSVGYTGGGSPFVGPLVIPVGQLLGTNYVFTASGGATLPNDGVLLAGSQADDALTDLVVPAGFNFSIYGTAITGGSTLRASVNGNLQVRSTKGADDFANTALPAAGAGNGQAVFPPTAPTLFLQWDDWRTDGAAGGAALDAGIYTKLSGSAPNRSWTIEWRGRIRGDGAVETNNNRAAIVFHEGSNSFDYVYLLTGVGASENGGAATIGVQAASTGSTFTQYAFGNAMLAPGTKLTAAIPPAICTSGGGTCGALAGVTVVQSGGTTTVAEGGATDSYSLVLDSQPVSDVTITITPGAQLTTNVPSVLFTPLNWNVPQNVTVTAIDDAVFEQAHTGTLTHAASGGGYTGVVIANVVAAITDNDVQFADLSVGNQRVGGSVTAGQRLTYEVVVENLSAGADVGTAQFAFTVGAPLANVSWTCVADAGADCPASGTGVPAHAIVLDGGTGVTYTIGADVPIATPAGTTIQTNATIAVAPPYQDNVTGNNASSTSDAVVAGLIFDDGFE